MLKIFGFIDNINESNIYCLRCKKYTENKNPTISLTTNGKNYDFCSI